MQGKVYINSGVDLMVVIVDYLQESAKVGMGYCARPSTSP
jgi:hypothetical protein